MAMIRHTDEPGSPAWHQRRARCYNAGDASAMLNCHPSGKTRTELLDELHTGLERQFSDFVQERVINPGHRVEALWRPIAEEILGEDLQVLAGELDVGLSRPLGASLDGITFMEDTNAECKSINDALRAALPHDGRDSHVRNDARQLPKGYRVQIEQQQLVTGATRTLFSAMAFDAEGNPTEERHCFYTSDPALRAEILAGWKQLDADRAKHMPAAPVEKIRAEPVEDFPVLSPITMTGDVVVHHELDAYREKLKAYVAQLPKDPKTDQEFANLEDSVKRRAALEKALKAERERALRGSPNIGALLTAIDELLTFSSKSRLEDQEKVDTKKEAMRLSIRNAAQAEFDAHVRSWNDKLGRPLLSTAKGTCKDAAIAQAMHGKKSVKGWQDGAAAAVVEAKVAVNMLGETLQANLAAFKELCAGQEALFRDLDSLLFKDGEAFRVICGGRIADAKAAEERRLEAERARIRAEEEARAAAKLREEQAAREAEERRQRAAAEEAQRQEAAALERRQREEEQARVHAQARAEQEARDTEERLEQERLAASLRKELAPAAGPAVIPMPTRAPAAAAPTAPTLKLGEIQKRLAPLSIDAAGLAAMGFPMVKQEGAAKLWREADWQGICAAIAQHVVAVANGQKAVA